MDHRTTFSFRVLKQYRFFRIARLLGQRTWILENVRRSPRDPGHQWSNHSETLGKESFRALPQRASRCGMPSEDDDCGGKGERGLTGAWNLWQRMDGHCGDGMEQCQFKVGLHHPRKERKLPSQMAVHGLPYRYTFMQIRWSLLSRKQRAFQKTTKTFMNICQSFMNRH